MLAKPPVIYPYYNRLDDPVEQPGDPWNRIKIIDASSWYIRNYRLKEALAVLEQIPDSVWLQEPYSDYIRGNAFYLNVYK